MPIQSAGGPLAQLEVLRFMDVRVPKKTLEIWLRSLLDHNAQLHVRACGVLLCRVVYAYATHAWTGGWMECTYESLWCVQAASHTRHPSTRTPLMQHLELVGLKTDLFYALAPFLKQIREGKLQQLHTLIIDDGSVFV